MSAKNGKLGKKKNTMKNVWKKREIGKQAKKGGLYLADGNAQGG